MDDKTVFSDFLNRIGLTLLRQRREVIEGLADTFQALSALEDSDIDAFVKRTSDNNRMRNHANQVQLTSRFIMDLKAALFELKDRTMCVAIPTQVMLQALTHDSLQDSRLSRGQAKRDAENRSKQKIPHMDVLKLTKKVWSDFKVAIQEVFT